VRYLVTGGAGFIGSHLVEALLARGDEAAILDNLSTGRLENLAAVEDRVRVVNGSVLDPLLVDELVADVDVVVHLAASVGVELIVEKPLHSFLTNIRGSEVVLEAAHRYRRKVLIASTSEVYGKSNDVPFREDADNVYGSSAVSRWGYAVSKRVDEVLAFAYHRERDLPVVLVRLFNTVGPRQSGAYGMVLPRFVERAVAGEPLLVHGNGHQTRCFCHVLDVVDALLRLLDDPGAEGHVFNIGSTEEVEISEVAERVVKATGSASAIDYIPYHRAFPEGFEDMRRRVPDISKIHDLVGWAPTRSLDDIIGELLQLARSGEARGTSSTAG
jgi:UDP-glucose 4-epimerase